MLRVTAFFFCLLFIPLISITAEGQRELFVLAIPGTFYSEAIYGGDPLSNFTNPMPANYGIEHSNRLFSILAHTFTGRDEIPLRELCPIDWGGANRDISHTWQNDYGRKDRINSWLRDMEERALEGGDVTFLVIGFSHGNQTAKMLLNKLAIERRDILQKTIFIAFSQPNRLDSSLEACVASQLVHYINIYNIYDRVAGRDRWARLDLIDNDGYGFCNKLNALYTPLAVNFEIKSSVRFFIKSHCYPLKSGELISAILDFYMNERAGLERGARVTVKPGETAAFTVVMRGGE